MAEVPGIRPTWLHLGVHRAAKGGSFATTALSPHLRAGALPGRTAVMNILQSGPSSSDISVWQFAAPLVLGGKTVILDSAATLTISSAGATPSTGHHRVGTRSDPLVDYLASLPGERRALPEFAGHGDG